MYRFRLLLLLAIPLLFMCSSNSSGPDDIDDVLEPEKLNVGVILPQYGVGPINGWAVNAALDLAIEDFNAYLSENDIDKEISVSIRDSNFDFQKTGDAISGLADSSTIMLAATTSENLYWNNHLVAEKDFLYVNTTSVSTELTHQDNILSLAPDDGVLAKAMASAIRENGINNLIIYHRIDNWGRNFAILLDNEFQAAGGNRSSTLAFNETILGSEAAAKVPRLNSLAMVVQQNEQPEDIAVVVVAFNESIDILKAASEYDSLMSMKWYGIESIGLNASLVNDPLAAATAERVGFVCPMTGELNSSEYISLKQRIIEKVGTFSPQAIIMYDAFFAAGQTLVNIEPGADLMTIQAKYVEIVESTNSISGPVELNENGDRTGIPYDFWGVKKEGDSFTWYKAY